MFIGQYIAASMLSTYYIKLDAGRSRSACANYTLQSYVCMYKLIYIMQY